MTRAPRSASCRVQCGADTACSTATTTTPSRGSTWSAPGGLEPTEDEGPGLLGRSALTATPRLAQGAVDEGVEHDGLQHESGHPADAQVLAYGAGLRGLREQLFAQREQR